VDEAAHRTFCECDTLRSLQLSISLSHIFTNFALFCISDFAVLCVMFYSEQIVNLYWNGRRFLYIEVHRDCATWQQCWTDWKLKASSSEGLYCYL